MDKPWIKSGLLNGLKITAIFFIISIIWALIVMISNDLGISPGWSMIAFTILAIFSASIDLERQKFISKNKLKEKYEDFNINKE